MSQSIVHHEKYHGEFSMELAAVCDITRSSMSVLYYDLSLDRSVARSVALKCTLKPENICTELAKLIFVSMREYSIPASALRTIFIAAPVDLSDAAESLQPTDIFLPPDVTVETVPFASMNIDGRYTAELAASVVSAGTINVQFGKSLSMSCYDGNKLITASIPLIGAFDGSGIESGIPCEYGAIDEVSREDGNTICYSVVGDADSMGVAPSAVLDSVSVMLDMGVIDSDGIMTDRDQFYIGEDFYISQHDVRAVQSDKAKAAAALECFVKHVGEFKEVFFTGEVMAGSRMKRLVELGVIPEAIKETAKFTRSTVEQGMIKLLTDEQECSRIYELIGVSEDITDAIYEELDEIYIRNLPF